ncbi:MAG: siderophore-interacting protein [Sciscionella sp.]
MPERAVRHRPRQHLARVSRTEWLTEHLIRATLDGSELTEFAPESWTDSYLKLLFGVDGVVYPEPFDIETIRRELPKEQWPRMRTYTVRAWDPMARELTVDFVYHGDKGLAGPWAAKAQPGDEIRFLGPGGGYAPDSGADWHLLAGDESALPAIATALESLPAGALARAFIEVAGQHEEQRLTSRGDADIVWLHRGERQVGDALVAAVSALEFLPGEPQAFVHGEAQFVKELRRHLRIDRGLPREQLSISGYWRSGVDDEGWRAIKREWNRQVEQEQEPTTPASP